MILPISQPGPTAAAVASAITHYRLARDLSQDQVAKMLGRCGHILDADAIAAIEDCRRPATVDDLVAFAHVLGTTPLALLTHIPDLLACDSPLATGLPDDVSLIELRTWMLGEIQLDPDSRVHWWRRKVCDLRIRLTHINDELEGDHAEIQELDRLGLIAQEHDAPPVQRLLARARSSEYELVQADLALAMAMRRVADMEAPWPGAEPDVESAWEDDGETSRGPDE